MPTAITHFEIYAEEPAKLADFYRTLLGWEIDKLPAIDYWPIQPGSNGTKAMHGGIMYRAIPGLNGWMLYVKVAALDEAVANVESLGGRVVRPKTAVPRVAWVTIVADPQGNIFGLWEADAKAFPMPEPD